MEEVKYNKIALILLMLISILILIYPPFAVSICVPIIIRVPLFLVLLLFSLRTVFFKKYFVRYHLPIITFFIVLAIYWISIGAKSSDVVYFLLYVFLALVLATSVKRNKSLKFLLVNFYLYLVLILSIFAILSFVAFNLELAPYKLKPLGVEPDVYMYYYNYIFGYVNPKTFESGVIGRVCGFMIEPSYQGWFLSTNLFLVSKLVQNNKYLFVCQLIVFFGALSSFSTMSWVVFAIVIASMLVFGIMSIFSLKEKSANVLYGLSLVVVLYSIFTVANQDNLLEILGPSSAEDRASRADASLFFLAMSSPEEFILGRGPGFISKSGYGESNPLLKLLVENGMVSTILVLIFIVYCSYRSKYFMISNLLWLNSVVVLMTPLFIINLLVCKWINEIAEERVRLAKI